MWAARFADPGAAVTVLAEHGGRAVGFVHLVPDDDGRWGSLVDNLHVVPDHQGAGLGALLRHAAGIATGHATHPGVYLWVLEQNTRAQGFYRAMGGAPVETVPVSPPGGVPPRLAGTPRKLRFAWPDATALVYA